MNQPRCSSIDPGSPPGSSDTFSSSQEIQPRPVLCREMQQAADCSPDSVRNRASSFAIDNLLSASRVKRFDTEIAIALNKLGI